MQELHIPFSDIGTDSFSSKDELLEYVFRGCSTMGFRTQDLGFSLGIKEVPTLNMPGIFSS